MNLHIVDNLDPETVAMLQAFYSRSHTPIEQRLQELNENGHADVKESLKKYYVNYGHDSIAQCGTTTIFIENVSLLAAKAIQDTPLYNGQETSTRFIDFSQAQLVDPLNDEVLLRESLNFYDKNFDVVYRHVRKQLENAGEHSDSDIHNAAKARTFDIMRAFLPAGVCTQLSWHTTLHHAKQHVIKLAYHPLAEVRNIAVNIANMLRERYPSAFADIAEQILKFKEYYSFPVAHYDSRSLRPDKSYDTFTISSAAWSALDLAESGNNVLIRAKHEPVHRAFNHLGDAIVEYMIDFAGFRDIQRHRNCTQFIPYLSSVYGFESWYLEQLPETFRAEAELHVKAINETLHEKAENLNDNDIFELQYYVPIGFKVACVLQAYYPSLVYIAELRSGKTVHPTVRKFAQKLAKGLEPLNATQIHADMSDVDFTIKRGQQTILKA